MIEQLFGSKTRVKLLQLFYSNPNRSFYVREITRKIDEQINSVRRELANLLSIGIIASDTTNNRLYYEVNQSYEYYEPLRLIFGQGGSAPAEPAAEAGESAAPTKKSVAVGGTTNAERDKIKALGNVEVALYTGQFTRDESSGIDALIVGDVNQHALQKFMAELESQEGKEIRYTVMPAQEFNYRMQIKDRFISTVLTAKKQVLIDKNGIL
ncbi:MAG TPA: transcriptional regulator [Candidatus Saccharimonadales bacterium]|nr:transcriptional regulator [Candidatus Saccharimonadales bacterium]